MNWDNKKPKQNYSEFLFSRNKMITMIGVWIGIGFMLGFLVFGK